MSALDTHFYEYHSLDADGGTIDLSVRRNSPTSTNTYSPVLTDEQATRFTVENVLGSTDSWLPTEDIVETEAVTLKADGKVLTWSDVPGARCYVVFCDGRYCGNVVNNLFLAEDDGVYTVRAASLCGGLGRESNRVGVGVVVDTAIGDQPVIGSSDSEPRYYSLRGVRLEKPQKGVNIMVIQTPEGLKTQKIVIK